jgi:hypothetical protein
VIVAVWLVVAEPTVAVNFPVVAPAATVIEAGVFSTVLLSESNTVDPPAGAAWDSVAVQLVLPPELTVVGVQARALREGATTVTDAVTEFPLSVAVIVAD